MPNDCSTTVALAAGGGVSGARISLRATKCRRPLSISGGPALDRIDADGLRSFLVRGQDVDSFIERATSVGLPPPAGFVHPRTGGRKAFRSRQQVEQWITDARAVVSLLR
jgi:hypothetical protein